MSSHIPFIQRTFTIVQSICLSGLPIFWLTDQPMVLFFSVTVSHSACFLPQSSYQRTNQQSHLLPVSRSFRRLTALCMTFTFFQISESDRRMDQPLHRQLVGAAESALSIPFMSLTSSQTSNGPKNWPSVFWFDSIGCPKKSVLRQFSALLRLLTMDKVNFGDI